MSRIVSITLALFVFLILSAGCSKVPAGQNQQEGPAAVSTVSTGVIVPAVAPESRASSESPPAAYTENSSVSASIGIDQIFEGVKEIDIHYDLERAAWNGYKPIVIKDAKIISDISAMVGKSIELMNSPAGNMSGMVFKNSLILSYSNGTRNEIGFSYDDPAFAQGFIELDGKFYDPGYSFFRYMADFSEYAQYDTVIDKKVEELFKKYGWTVDYRIQTYNESLPDNLKHEAGEYPVKLYWAYNNELSKNIGLDYSDYAGKSVEVELYRLREPLPDFLSPRMNARGILLRCDGKIIGAYIDAGRHDCFACSLDRKSLKDITGKEWNGWVEGYINFDNALEIKLSKMKPEEVIAIYYDAINRHDEKTQFACMTRKRLCSYLAMNMDNNKLFNKDFGGAYFHGESNVKSVKLFKTRELKDAGNQAGTIEFEATVNYQFKKEITNSSGIQPRFLLLEKETETGGWRISSEGTGP